MATLMSWIHDFVVAAWWGSHMKPKEVAADGVSDILLVDQMDG